MNFNAQNQDEKLKFYNRMLKVAKSKTKNINLTPDSTDEDFKQVYSLLHSGCVESCEMLYDHLCKNILLDL